jgi:hypothetical protein
MVHSWSNYFTSENIQLLQLTTYCYTGNKYVFTADKLYLFMVKHYRKQGMYSRVPILEINQDWLNYHKHMNPFSIQHNYLGPKTYEKPQKHKITSKSTKIHRIMEEQPHSTKHTSNQPHQRKDRASHSQGLSVIQDSVVSSWFIGTSQNRMKPWISRLSEHTMLVADQGDKSMINYKWMENMSWKHQLD